MTAMQAQANGMMGGTDIVSLISLTHRLIDVLSTEIAALRAMRPRDIEPLQAEKTALTSQYERGLAGLKANAASLDAMDAELAAELTQSTARLQDVIADNRQALEAARDVNERLIGAIATEVARQRNPAETYGPGGTAPQKVAADRKAGPIKLDQQI